MPFPVSSSHNPEIQYRLASLPEVDDIALFLKDYFFTREPLAVASQLQIGPKEWAWIQVFVRNVIRDGFVYKAVDTSKIDTLAAVKLVRVKPASGGARTVEDLEEEDLLNNCSWVLRSNLAFVTALKNGFKSYALNSLQSTLFNEITVARDDYGGRGLCTELLSLAEEHTRKTHNVRFSVVTATNPFAQRSYAKSGYTVVHELDFNTFEYEGKYPFRNLSGEKRRGQLLVKIFE